MLRGNSKSIACSIAAAGLFVLLVAALAASCANDPTVLTGQLNTTQQATATQATVIAGLNSAKIDFHFSNFYSLTSPNPETHCAGDAITYYDPFAYANASIDAAEPLQADVSNPSITIQPPFITNVSVDLTDSNTLIPSNLAYSCSYGATSTAPPPSNCSTFDYGAAAGIYSNMSGSILMVGGIQGVNSAGVPTSTSPGNNGASIACGTLTSKVKNTCGTSVYALAIDTLPASVATDPPSSLAPGLTAATGPISTWANLSAAAGYAGPQGVAGAAATFDPGLRELLVFGGVSAATTTTTTGGTTTTTALDIPTTQTWLFDFATQAWTQPAFSANVDSSLVSMPDTNPSIGTLDLAKSVGARALFGYAPIQGVALSQLSSGTTATNNLTAADLDLTDRLAIVGGYTSENPIEVANDTHRLNPTYGPDIVDVSADSAAIPSISQWIDSYYVQLMNNSQTTSLYAPTYPLPAPSPSASPMFPVGFGLVGITDSLAGGSVGSLVAVGGFNANVPVNSPTTSGGTFTVGAQFSFGVADTGDVTMIPDSLPASGSTELEPITWSAIGSTTVPWYGGVSMVPGLSPGDVVYFGGTNVTSYITTTTGAVFNNPGVYWQGLTAQSLLSGAAPTTVAMSGTVPSNAGMSAARGMDPDGNPIVVAWGGMNAAGTFNPTVYYLHKTGGNLVWTGATVATTSPTYFVNSALVFSHVTGKFYLFGGYSPVTMVTGADTWELSITNPAGTNCATNANCTFAWTQLNVANGLTCTPVCPSARRSHSMAEVNYYNTALGTGFSDPQCPVNQPCSFGIFMEGGTPDGVNIISNRWMFDPTANAGYGAWLEMQDMPPRTLAAMSSADYVVPSTNQTVHRAVLFGGETAMEDPLESATTTGPAGHTGAAYFVPPTLGDTWIFDFDKLSWNRAILLGQGYTTAQSTSTLSGINLGESFVAGGAASAITNASTTVLTPPAISGAVMVTRTNGPSGPLAIPEIYMIGGRTKDGHYVPLSQMYKFCLGTAQERGTDATCWDYDPDTYDPAGSPHINQPVSAYTGRWFLKSPGFSAPPPGVTSTANVGSYLGAAAYDPVDDRIILFEGLTPDSGAAAVNTFAVTNDTVFPSVATTPYIYEYTAPTESGTGSAAADGSWAAVPPCAGSTPPSNYFYGHTMSYDSLNHQMVIVGGYDVTGEPNVTGGIPAVWSAKRMDVAGSGLCYDWNPITIFGNGTTNAAQEPPMGGIAHAASLYVPPDGYNSSYYLSYDSSCVGAGPIAVTDPTINRLLAGGAYFDIDRSQLGPNENLILNLTYLPMGQTMEAQNGTPLTANDEAYFEVHLVHTGQTVSQLQAVSQPRYLTYSATDQYPEVVQNLFVLAPPTGQMRAEQIVVPISADPSIDRIQIQRYSGSAILVNASLFRLGYR